MGDTAILSLRLPLLSQPYLSKLLSRPSLCFTKQLYPLVFSSRRVLYLPLVLSSGNNPIIRSWIIHNNGICFKKFILPCGGPSVWLVCVRDRLNFLTLSVPHE